MPRTARNAVAKKRITTRREEKVLEPDVMKARLCKSTRHQEKRKPKRDELK